MPGSGNARVPLEAKLVGGVLVPVSVGRPFRALFAKGNSLAAGWLTGVWVRLLASAGAPTNDVCDASALPCELQSESWLLNCTGCSVAAAVRAGAGATTATIVLPEAVLPVVLARAPAGATAPGNATFSRVVPASLFVLLPVALSPPPIAAPEADAPPLLRVLLPDVARLLAVPASTSEREKVRGARLSCAVEP